MSSTITKLIVRKCVIVNLTQLVWTMHNIYKVWDSNPATTEKKNSSGMYLVWSLMIWFSFFAAILNLGSDRICHHCCIVGLWGLSLVEAHLWWIAFYLSSRSGWSTFVRKNYKGGLNCVLKNFSFLRSEKLFPNSESDLSSES